MSVNEVKMTNLNEFKVGNDYLIKLCNPVDKYYDGIYTYIGHNKFSSLVFINLTYKLNIITNNLFGVSIENVNFIGGILTNINSTTNVPYFTEGCNIFKIETNEYILK
jgi:hypothetical protein